MSVPLCTFIREATGTTCGSPAMKDSDRCYHHQLDHERQQYLKNVRQDPANRHVMEAIELPPLETADDIQICLSNLFHAVAARRLSLHDVDRLLAVLRLASRNVRLKMQAEQQAQYEDDVADDEGDAIPDDCVYDEQLRPILELLSPSPLIQHMLHQLTTEDYAGRHGIRKELFECIRQDVAELKAAVAKTQDPSTGARDDNQPSALSRQSSGTADYSLRSE